MSFVAQALPALLRGTLVTLEIAFCASLIGFFLGTILGFLQASERPLIKSIVTIYATLFRGTPMLIQIPFLNYFLPALGLPLPITLIAIIAIGLNSAAYISQIIRSGISSISIGQYEAAEVLGFTPMQTIRYIILPQALRTVTPSLLNEFITLIKDSSLASTIGVVELFKEGSIIISRTYNVLPVYGMIAAIYLLLTTTLSLVVHKLERSWKVHAETN